MDPGPFAKSGRIGPEINGNIEDFAGDDLNKLGLGMFDLKVKASYSVFQRIRKIILNKCRVDSGRVISVPVISLHKEAAFVLKNLGLNDENSFYGCSDNFHEKQFLNALIHKYDDVFFVRATIPDKRMSKSLKFCMHRMNKPIYNTLP